MLALLLRRTPASHSLRVRLAARLLSSLPPPKKKRVRPPIPRDPTPSPHPSPPPPPQGASISVLSTNVAGLRAVLRPGPKRAAFRATVLRADPDLICLQETKLQGIHVEAAVADLRRLLPDYAAPYWACSAPPGRKGYSGVAFLIKRGSPADRVLSVSYGLGTAGRVGSGESGESGESGGSGGSGGNGGSSGEDTAVDHNGRELPVGAASGAGGDASTNTGTGTEASVGTNLGADTDNTDNTGTGSDAAEMNDLEKRMLALQEGSPERVALEKEFASPSHKLAMSDAALDALEDVVGHEGRVISLELPHLWVVGTYVPNAGATLARLPYRVGRWDRRMGNHIRALEEGTPLPHPSAAAHHSAPKPVVLVGDLNVAHGVRDMYNFYARPQFPDNMPGAEGAEEQYVCKGRVSTP